MLKQDRRCADCCHNPFRTYGPSRWHTSPTLVLSSAFRQILTLETSLSGAPGDLLEKRSGPRAFPGSRSEVEILACSLPVPAHRLQYLFGVVEGVGARVPYLVDHILWRPIILDLRYDLVLAGREVKVRQELLELSQVEITQVAQIAKAHCLVPPISSFYQRQVRSYPHCPLCQTNASTVREALARLPDLEPACLISVTFACISGNRKGCKRAAQERGAFF